MSLGVLLLFLASNEAAEGTFFLRPRVVRERLAAAFPDLFARVHEFHHPRLEIVINE